VTRVGQLGGDDRDVLGASIALALTNMA
jgi:hypothetical protein